MTRSNSPLCKCTKLPVDFKPQQADSALPWSNCTRCWSLLTQVHCAMWMAKPGPGRTIEDATILKISWREHHGSWASPERDNNYHHHKLETKFSLSASCRQPWAIEMLTQSQANNIMTGLCDQLLCLLQIVTHTWYFPVAITSIHQFSR